MWADLTFQLVLVWWGLWTPVGILLMFVIPAGVAIGTLSGHLQHRQQAKSASAPFGVFFYSCLTTMLTLTIGTVVLFSDWAWLERSSVLSGMLPFLILLSAAAVLLFTSAAVIRRSYRLSAAESSSFARGVLTAAAVLFVLWLIGSPST